MPCQAYLFEPLDSAIATAARGVWRGGLNLTALSMLEQRAFGWYHYYSAKWNQSNSSRRIPGVPGQPLAELYLDRGATGTATGLAKMPYLRDTRRSVGLDGFRLAYTSISNPSPSARFGVRFADSVAIGSYAHDTHSISTAVCHVPHYLSAPPAKPYYIPMRALTNDGAENLLVCGKTMATTFSTNSATRLHPEEWSSGVAGR
jgi:hypothetical protein